MKNHMRAVWGVFALLVALFIAAPAMAGEVYTASGPQGSVRLLDVPCDVTMGWLKMKKAEMKWRGKDYKACWAISEAMVIVFDEAGDIGSAPIQAFKKEENI